MKKLGIWIIVLTVLGAVNAAEVKWTAKVELTAIADSDVLLVVDDPTGTPISKKITVLNFFDTINTSAKLATIITDGTGTGVAVFGTAPTFTTEMTLTPVASPTTDTDGEWAIDIDGWGSGFDAFEFFNSTASAYFVATTASDTPTNGQVPKWNTGGEITWEADNDSGGATAWDAITDPSGSATVDFLTTTQTIDIGVTDTGGPKTGWIFDITGLGVGTTDVIALQIQAQADDDTDFIPFRIQDNLGVSAETLFLIDSTGTIQTGIWDAGAVTSSGAVQGSSLTDGTATITGGALTGLTTALTVAQAALGRPI